MTKTQQDSISDRRRVRTPGKHIVLFALAATLMLALSTTALRSVPEYRLPDLTRPGGSDLHAPKETFLTDLSPDASGRIAYLKLSATIVAKDAAALAEMKAKQPQIRERLSFFLRELSPEDFEGSEGQERIKAEMLKRARLPLSGGAAVDLIVEDIVIQ